MRRLRRQGQRMRRLRRLVLVRRVRRRRLRCFESALELSALLQRVRRVRRVRRRRLRYFESSLELETSSLLSEQKEVGGSVSGLELVVRCSLLRQRPLKRVPFLSKARQQRQRIGTGVARSRAGCSTGCSCGRSRSNRRCVWLTR